MKNLLIMKFNKLLKQNLLLSLNNSNYNSHAASYLLGQKQNSSLINLKISFKLIKIAKFLIKQILTEQGSILIFSKKNPILHSNITKLNLSYNNNITLIENKWIGGSLTNKINKSTNKIHNIALFLTNPKTTVSIIECSNLGIFTIGLTNNLTNIHLYNLPILLNTTLSSTEQFIFNKLFDIN